MAGSRVSVGDDITAPALLGLHRWGAWVIGGALVTTMALTVWAPASSPQITWLLWASTVVAALGVVGVLAVRRDPMPALIGWLIGAAGPVACAMTCVALTAPIVNANKTNVLGVGVAVAAYLCVRGRTGVAWTSLAAMIAVFVWWSTSLGQGPWIGFGMTSPNIAVLAMSTLFAAIMRPAAATIRQLRGRSIREAEDLEEEKARTAEGELRRRELSTLALPMLTAIAAGHRVTTQQIAEIPLIDGQLRDGILARSLQIPAVTDAARVARSRGVVVRMFDDGGLDDGPTGVLVALRVSAVDVLQRTGTGAVTIRIQPPGRTVLATIVVERADGSAQRVEFDAGSVPNTEFLADGDRMQAPTP